DPAVGETVASERVGEPAGDAANAAPTAVASPEQPVPVPTFDDDDPLFEPLPPLEMDPDHEPPEEHVSMLRALLVDGLHASARMRATAQLDAEVLRTTHDGRAFDGLAVQIEKLAGEGLVERTPDLRFSELVIDFRGPFTVWAHTCVHWGPRSGLY